MPQAFNITSSDLDSVASWQGLDPDTFSRPGDFLIVRSGFMKQYSSLSVNEEQILPFRAGDDAAWIGLEPNEDTLRWIWEKKISLLGSDNPSIEPHPENSVIGGVKRNLHQVFIGGWGQSLGGLFDTLCSNELLFHDTNL
jgi:kynurenine formamidase